MTAFINQLQDKLELELQAIESSEKDFLRRIRQSIPVAEKVLNELRNYIRGYLFRDTTEEISFYKEVEPRFHARLIYYVRLYQLETCKPAGGKEMLETFFKDELKRIYRFFTDNKDFYRYYRTGSDYLDEIYFTSKRAQAELMIEEYSCILDEQLCTTHGYKIAKILAYERLQKFLAETLDELSSATGHTFPFKGRFKWTGPKVALTEYMYGLVYSGMINNGQVQVKELAELLQFIFDIDLGNYYRSRQEMYTRKKTAQYLELMLKRYQEGMNEADERYRY